MVKLNKTKFFFMIVLLFLFLGLNCLSTGPQPWFTTENGSLDKNIIQSRLLTQKVTSTQAYIERGPITISSDFQLNNSGVTGFKGNGTIDDPIRIEGYNITASGGYLIYIRDTTYYFTIQNNLLNGLGTSSYGIYFWNVVNGTIANNIIMNSSRDGIRLSSSFNNTVSNNTVHNNNWYGIRLITSANSNTLINNTVFNNNQNGIGLEGFGGSHNNTITNNTIFNNLYDGIKLMQSSNENMILNNTVYLNTQNGIWLERSKYNFISSNIVFSNDDGIRLFVSSSNNTVTNNIAFNNSWNGIAARWDSNNNIISNNTVYNSLEDGINIIGSYNNDIVQNIVNSSNWRGIAIQKDFDGNVGSENNTIDSNIVYKNNLHGLELIDSNHNVITKNIFHNNYEYGIKLTLGSEDNIIEFNDFFENNRDGFEIYDAGPNNLITNNFCDDRIPQDSSPLPNPYHLSAPAIITPTAENLTLAGNVFIQWDASVDTFGHSLTYSVFYSTNDGVSWITLASGLNSTNHTFVTTTVSDGTFLQFKIHTVDSIGFVAKTVSTETFLILNALSPPVIKFPNGGTTLNGTVTIEWSTSFDPYNHSIIYSVYYSSNNGDTWTQLASELTTTSYRWNSTAVPNGFNYLIKVVTTCSEGTTVQDISDGTLAIQNAIPTTTETSTTSSLIPGMTGLVLLVAMFTLLARRINSKM
ncbi:MAG: right-handed parallel beta-helix repeat-containing protein [Candidatus Hodarchaeales archaeon]